MFMALQVGRKRRQREMRTLARPTHLTQGTLKMFVKCSIQAIRPSGTIPHPDQDRCSNFAAAGAASVQDKFFENLKREAIEQAMKELEQRIQAAAASIIDPETGKHAEVFVRRTGETQLALRTRGSPALARELEKRVGIETGSIEPMSTLPANDVPRVYLAHASEDHVTLAKPLAERLIASGIDVWLDEWEIRAGDSCGARWKKDCQPARISW